MQIDDHKKDVQYLQNEASTAKDPQLKSFIHSKHGAGAEAASANGTAD
jgi:hypothetical protein